MQYTIWAAEHLKEGTFYKVHSVYKRTVNILVANKILALHPKEIAMTPLSIQLDLSTEVFSELAQAAGRLKRIFWTRSGIKVGLKEWKHKEIIQWDPKPGYTLGKEAIQRLHQETGGFLKQYGPAVGAMADSAVCTEPQPGDDMLTRMFREQAAEIYKTGIANPVELAKACKPLIGAGNGLTPSGDDFVTGMLLAFHITSSIYEIEKEHFYGEIEPYFFKTNDISRQYLCCALRGEAGILWHQLWKSWDQNENRTKALEQIKGIGHSSGIDTLNGMYAGLSMML